MTRLRAILAVLVLACAVAATQALGSGGSKTLSYLDISVVSTPAFDAGQGEPRPGDRVFLTDRLYRWSGSHRGATAGTVKSTLTFMSTFGAQGATVDLTGQLFLRGGALRVEGVVQIRPGPNHFILPIVGGTGSYAGARGTVDLKDIGTSGDRSAVVIQVIG
jgi:hypothetical protein